MKTMFKLTTSSEDMDGFDGVELMQFEDDIQEIIPPKACYRSAYELFSVLAGFTE